MREVVGEGEKSRRKKEGLRVEMEEVLSVVEVVLEEVVQRRGGSTSARGGVVTATEGETEVSKLRASPWTAGREVS